MILYGERVLADPAGAAALVAIADALNLRGRDGAGLLGVPSTANARGLREAGVLPFAGPGLAPVDRPGRSTAEIAAAAAAGELAALWLVGTDPLETHPERSTWDAGLERASTVIAHAGYLTAGVLEHATIVFPTESHAEHEGTIVHPDGRVQRLRQAIARPGEVRAGWWILSELAKRLDVDVRVLTGPMASTQLFAAVPFYAGLTLDAIGGKGLRWPADASAAAAWPATGADARRSRRRPRRPPRSRTAACAWAPTARSGPAPRSPPPPPCSSSARARASSCRRTTRSASASSTVTRSRSATAGAGWSTRPPASARRSRPAAPSSRATASTGPLVDVRKRPATEPADPEPVALS